MKGEKVTLSSCSLQVDTVVVEVRLLRNRTYFEMSVPISSSCMTSFIIPRIRIVVSLPAMSIVLWYCKTTSNVNNFNVGW